MAKVGAAASVKKQQQSAPAPAAQPTYTPAQPTGMAMTPQTVTAYSAPVSYDTPVPNQASYVSGKNLNRISEDRRRSRWVGDLDYWSPMSTWNWAQLTKNRAEDDRSMGGGNYAKSQIADRRFRNKIDHPDSFDHDEIWWPTTSYAGNRAVSQPSVDQNFFDLWLLANGIRF